MSSIESLKEKARRHEQEEKWREALDLYGRAVEKLEEDEQPDIGLYNRMGDLQTRLGNLELAAESYEKAVALYVESGLPNNAIAVCKKILRNMPHRSSAYLTMGQIRAEQGFLVDARANFLTYAERMQELGDMDEAFRALIEFAELAPEDLDIRMTVAEQLLQSERRDEAAEQLAAGYRLASSAGEDDTAAAFEERLAEVDPALDVASLAAAPPAASWEGPLPGERELGADFGTFGAVAGGPEGARPGEEAASPEEETAGAAGVEEEPEPLPGLEPDEEPEPLPTLDVDDREEEVWDPSAAMQEALEEARAEEKGTVEGLRASRDSLAAAGDVEGALEANESLIELEPDEVEHRQRQVELAAQLNHDATLASAYLQLARTLERSGEGERARSVYREVLSVDPGNAFARGALGEEVLLEEPPVREPEPPVQEPPVEEPPVEEPPVEEPPVEEPPVEEPAVEEEPPVEEPPVEEPAGEAVDDEGEPVEPPRPAEVSTEEYVDLGGLVLEDESEKTTRFRVSHEEPTGDEQADFAKMLSQFKEKVSRNLAADDVKAHHDLGTAYKEMGLLDEAIAEFQSALRASAHHLPTYELLGQAFIEKGQHQAAVRSLSRALDAPYQVEDELIGIYYHLGRAHEALGNTDSAREFYDRVFSMDINFADVTERLRELR